MQSKRNVFLLSLLYLGLAVFYFLLHANYEHFPSDDGSVLASAWRIFNGQVPHRDFISVRPAFSYYLHTIWFYFPEGWQFLAARFGFYIEMALTAFLPALWFFKTQNAKVNLSFISLAVIFYAFAVHAFLPMPWTTVDGVLCGYIALTFLLFSLTTKAFKKQLIYRALASLVFAMTAFFKQGFVFLFVGLALFSLYEFIFIKDKAETVKNHLYKFIFTALPGVLFVLGYFLYLYRVNAFNDFIIQMFTQTKDGLRVTGFVVYFCSYFQWTIVLGFVMEVFKPGRLLKKDLSHHWLNGFFVFLCLILIMHIIVFRYLGLPFAAKGLFWLCVGILLGKCFFWVVYKNIENKPFFVFIVGLLFIAWSSSISWGYRHPILALAPMGLVLFDVSSFLKENWFKKAILVITASIVFICSNYLIIKNSFFPTGFKPRSEQTYNLSTIFPRYGKIFAYQSNYESLAELKRFIEKHAFQKHRLFSVAPMHPIIYFLTNTLNPLSVDWLGETEYNGLVDRLAHDFERHKPVLIVAKTPYWWPLAVSPKRTCKELSQTYEEYETGFSKTFSTNQSMFLTKLIHIWTPIDEGKYFCVFLHPSLKN